MVNVKKIKDALKPLYEELKEEVSSFRYKKAYFCVQWGKKFPKEKNKGLMFVGRALYKSDSKTEDIDVLFGETDEAIFNHEEQMLWVYDQKGAKNGYNSNRSAFWRVVQDVSNKIYDQDESLNNVVWSNLYKVSQRKGNPNNALREAQLQVCKKMLEKEIEILSPKVVIFLTGKGWAMDFLMYLNGEREIKSIKKASWDKYHCSVYNINGTIYILSEHPQGKKENPHKQCIEKLIKLYSK